MDTLTHALSGALLARATAPTARHSNVSVRARVAAGFVAGAFPDIDFILGFVSPIAYVTGHRGITHSVIFLPLWAILLAWIFARIDRGRASWKSYYWVATLSIGIHIVGDVITSFGTMIFAPFSDARIAWGTTFIIDLWLTGIIVLALLISAIWNRSRIPATLGLTVLVAYIGLQTAMLHRALDFGREFAAANGLAGDAVSALPRPISPFNWMVTVSEPTRYRYTFVNLLRTRMPQASAAEGGFLARLDAAYTPRADAKWHTRDRFGADPADISFARAAWEQSAFAFYRWFSAMPALVRVDRGNPSTCAWFEDLRFLTPGRDTMPFRFGVCREGERSEWRVYQLTDGGKRVPAR